MLLNQSNETRNIGFNSGFCGVLTDLLNDKKTYPCDGYVSIDVSPKSSMILVSNGHNISIDFSDEIKNKPIEKIEKTVVEELYEEEIVLGKYRHFKGNEYEVVGFAKDSETTEKLVIYKALYGKQELWVRPYNMFREIIERDGKKLRRFTKI